MDIRPLVPEQSIDYLRHIGTLFGFDITPDREYLEAELFAQRFEFERSRCVFEDGELVGTLGSHSLEMTVPGGLAPCGGTTMVTVRPDRRRRGILTAMMRAHLAEAKEHGDLFTALFASDSAIYGRFGYGVGSLHAYATIDRAHVDLHRLAAPPGSVRMVDGPTARAAAPEVFENSRRPGMFARSEAWWNYRWRDDPEDRHGGLAFRYAIAGDADRPTGYVQYRIYPGDWNEGHGNHTIEVVELLATNPESWSGLWSLVINSDLTVKIKTGARPVDDPLFNLLAGPRRTAHRVSDQLNVRILDVPGALSARHYSSDGALTFAVVDSMGLAQGSFRLAIEGGKGTCSPTKDQPDIHLDIEDLGSAYLGMARFRELASAGRVGGSSDTLALADAMFNWFPAPWCQEVF